MYSLTFSVKFFLASTFCRPSEYNASTLALSVDIDPGVSSCRARPREFGLDPGVLVGVVARFASRAYSRSNTDMLVPTIPVDFGFLSGVLLDMLDDTEFFL